MPAPHCHCLLSAVFWFSLATLAFTFAGYPLWMAWRARGRTLTAPPAVETQPVTVLLIAHQESGRIRERISNLLASDYPPEKLRVLVVSDGSTDDTVAQVESLADPRVHVLALPVRGGKAAGLNAGMAAIESGLVVLADARQSFAPDAIRRLAASLADPSYGAVSGELEIANAQSGTGAGVSAYWKLERFLRRAEAATDSCVGCTGAIYAIRRSLFVPLPPDTILDDVVIPMQIAGAGYRVGHDREARAFDPQALEPENESRRKTRTLAGNFQMLFRYPGWLLPWRHRLWWRLLCHKYLRLAAPALLVLLAVSSALLSHHPFFLAALLSQAVFYLLAAIGMVTPLRSPIFSLPAGFVFLNAAVVRAFARYLFDRDLARWKSAPPARP